ncbi:MAG: chemotaxis protein CheW [Pseudomonadota bacterium]|nr:chemotaxis protein CheW [Pseudomonadota bacterium]
MDDLLNEFLIETSENLSVLDVELIRLEQNPNDPELLGNIFRLVHTIKGTCGFLGLLRLETVAHSTENVLGKFRDGELKVDSESVSLVLAGLDAIKAILTELEASEKEPVGNDTSLIKALDALAEGGPAIIPTVPAPILTSPAKPEPKPVVAASAKPEPEPIAEIEAPEKAEPRESVVVGSSIRVHVDLLEHLMTQVSELVLTRNQLLQILRSEKESTFTASLQRLNHVVSDLQEGVIKTRMQPIGNAWANLPRVVHDLAREMGKKIDLKMHGDETELDRQVLELVKDPLTHMVRNSVDHGIEAPLERINAGKPETGVIRLDAYHDGGYIIIEIHDDGKGLDTDRLRRKGVQLGMISDADASAMTDQQINQLIFKPGFSTALEITAVSGRGVGMDVVKTNIEKMGGTIELVSTKGEGSKITIKIPLTLSIISALIIECAGECFAVPQISVLELVRVVRNSKCQIEKIKDTPVLRRAGRLMPLVSLQDILKLDHRAQDDERDEAFIIVTKVGACVFGIIAHRVFDTIDIVVKPVAPILRHIEVFSGNTILGDGSVVMILDPNGIATATGEIVVADLDHERTQIEEEANLHRANTQSLLMFKAGGHAPKAVPLSLVVRLENIEIKSIEYSNNNQPVVQYHGELMPLVPCDPAFQLGGKERQPVLVFTDDGRSMGLIVDEIIDIVEETVDVQLKSEIKGLMGSAIIDGKASDVIDISHYLAHAFSDWFGSKDRDAFGDEGLTQRVMLVDDSPFFRNMLTPLLKISGYDVTAVDSAVKALELCEQGADFDVIISDIEMPGMNGFEFARRLHDRDAWKDVPIIALSSYASEKDLNRGRDAGFADYVAKFDRDALLNSLSLILTNTKGAV